MKKHYLKIVIAITIFFYGCGIRNIHSIEGWKLADQHKTVAIMPPLIFIKCQGKVNADTIVKMEKLISLSYQKAMYNWILGAKMQGKIKENLEIQDIKTTNEKLTISGYFSSNDADKLIGKTECSNILGVDGVISSIFGLYMPKRGAPWNRGLWWIFRKKSISVILSIYDEKTNKLILRLKGNILSLNGRASNVSVINETMDKIFYNNFGLFCPYMRFF